jgi:prepilin-type N-terminal cleavage/methylation domain-containing protein
MNTLRRHHAFSLIELLVVMAIISILVGLLMPALSAGRDAAEASKCLANLRSQGQSVACYQQDYKSYFPPYNRTDYPTPGRITYFWGAIIDSGPDIYKIDRSLSWLMNYQSSQLDMFLCPSQPWNSFVPQPDFCQETCTNYGYNGYSLDPYTTYGRVDAQGSPLPRRRIDDLPTPEKLLVFADSGFQWRVLGVWIFQNSTSLDPVTFTTGTNRNPTNHFRHRDGTQALLADGHGEIFSWAANWTPVNQTAPTSTAANTAAQLRKKLGFIAATNKPRYDQ